jgi:hypothetical protein
MKWPQILVVLLGVIAVAFAVRSRKAETAAASAPAAAAFDVGRPLPLATERPGVVGRQIGLLRVTVAAAPEITLGVAPSGGEIESVPILVVLENDTYQPLASASLGWVGKYLCSVRITRRADDTEVFQSDVPLPTRLDWLSAERRQFVVDWPVQDVPPGSYRISVQLGLPDQPVVEVATRVL